jgi:TolB protein
MVVHRRITVAAIAGVVLLLVFGVAFENKVYAQLASSTTASSTSSALAATSTPPVSGKFILGDRIYTTAAVKARATPDLTSAPIGTEASSTPATVIGGPVQTGSSILWNLDYGAGTAGWSLENYLAKPAPTSTPFVGFSPSGEQKLTSLLTYRSNPRVSGTAVVWADGRNGGSDIYLYDLGINSETRLTGGIGFDTHPSIDSSRVAYLDRVPDKNNPGHDITQVFVFDLSARSARPLDPGTSFQSEPEISGDLVAYVQNTLAGRNLILYHLVSNTKDVIATGSDISAVRLAGTHLVWMDSVSGVWKVFSYDLGTDGTKMLFNDPGDQMNPAVSSDGKVVFADRRGGSGENDWHVYLFDPGTGTAGPITKGTGSQPTGLSISGNLVTWAQDGEIHLYNLTAGTEAKLTRLPGERSEPSLSGNTLVWLDGRNGAGDVYLWNVK